MVHHASAGCGLSCTGNPQTPADTGSLWNNSVQSCCWGYFVVAGDTLFGIAQRFDTTVAQIRLMNGIAGDLIRVDQILKLPSGPCSDGRHSR
ncbi:LysM peptidoglycan-binding domain-containing protein [Candidatus Woesebacteria bacterium]|nr:LysM peptidoglycan-binding domain-containing protein [Candidatus Woesebacteria bacterium]